MGDVSVLVPYRGDDGGPRDRAWAYVQRWYAEGRPGWQVVQGACPPGPWIKALAVADALSRADGHTLCIADADILCAGVAAAVDAVRAGVAWAVPHRRVYRLTPETTEVVLSGGPLPPPDVTPVRTGPAHQRVRTWKAPPFSEVRDGAAGGGLVVLPRALYEEVPLDPRFQHWGQEDTSWARALTVLVGPPWRGTAHLWHLYHPHAERMNRMIGNPEGLALRLRYREATTPEAMRALLGEFVGASR